MTRILRLLGRSIFLWLIAATAYPQGAGERAYCERTYSPTAGQQGKDVIWLPTPDHLVGAMLKAANTTAADIVYDLGAGDGKIAIAAAKDFGARAIGVEYDTKMASYATCLVSAAKLKDKVKIIQGDIFETDFSEATVVTLYLLPTLNERLIPTLLKMKPGTRIVSHSFLMGDWRPDRHIVEEGYDRAYLWIVPAQVAGTWNFQAPNREPLTVKLTQKYQTLEGAVTEGEQQIKIQDAFVNGNEFTFTFVGPKGARTLKATIGKDATEAAVSEGQQAAKYRGTKS